MSRINVARGVLIGLKPSRARNLLVRAPRVSDLFLAGGAEKPCWQGGERGVVVELYHPRRARGGPRDIGTPGPDGRRRRFIGRGVPPAVRRRRAARDRHRGG